MNIIENIRLSFKGIISHKLRSVLTMLGIIIGISSIITIVSIIQGASMSLKDSFVGGDSNTVMLQLYDKENAWGGAYNASLSGTLPGINRIREESVSAVTSIEGVAAASPVYFKEDSIQVKYNNKSEYSSAYGVEKDFFDVKNLILMSGRLFIDRDYEKKSNVIIISSEIASEFFPNQEAVGKTLVLGSDLFVVVGVVMKDVDYSEINSMSDYFTKLGFSAAEIYVPETSWNLVGGYDDIQSLIIKVGNVNDIVKISSKAAEVLNADILSDKYEYKSGSLSEDTNYIETITKIASILLIGIASISLFVGGIGVMNIMLVSVTERTKEIDLKKALGAKRKVILAQFLTESVVLTSCGGIIGVLLGVGVAYLVSTVTGMPIAVSGTAIAVSVGFSMFVGIAFGLLPSIKASKLDPIDALRYE